MCSIVVGVVSWGLSSPFSFFVFPWSFFSQRTCRVCEHVLTCGWGCVVGLVRTFFFFWCSHGLFLFNVHVGCVSMCSIVVGVVSWGLYSLFFFFVFTWSYFFGHVLTYGGGLFLLVMYSLVYCFYLPHMNLLQSVPSTTTPL